MEKTWVKKLILLTPKLYKLLLSESERRDIDLNSLIRQILYEYFEPKPQINSNQNSNQVDPKKIDELIKLTQEQSEKTKDLEIIKKRLDSLISEPEEDLSELLKLCRTPKTLFELSRELGKKPEELIVLLRYLVKTKKVAEMDGKFKSV